MKRTGFASIALALVLGTIIAGAIIACGGVQKPGQDPNLIKRIQISDLWTQIRGWRSEAKMDLDPTPKELFGVENKSVREIERKACPDGHKVPASCNDICSIAENICDNAEAICNLADELGNGDDFAQGKCKSAKASCQDAKKRCCGCSEGDKSSSESTTGSIW